MYTYHSIIAFTSKYVVSSIFEALNNCQCRQRVGNLGVQTSAKKGSSDEPKLDFSGSSRAMKVPSRAEPSRAGAL